MLKDNLIFGNLNSRAVRVSLASHNIDSAWEQLSLGDSKVRGKFN